tara:strand:+ start:727 stop:1179 length:453 start_codon:yes stop_codon:yes gene_type:complete
MLFLDSTYFALDAASYIRSALVENYEEALEIKTLATIAGDISDMIDMIELSQEFTKHQKKLNMLNHEMSMWMDRIEGSHELLMSYTHSLWVFVVRFIERNEIIIEGKGLEEMYSSPHADFSIDGSMIQQIKRKQKKPRHFRRSKMSIFNL